jgi:hypothetical protein
MWRTHTKATENLSDIPYMQGAVLWSLFWTPNFNTPNIGPYFSQIFGDKIGAFLKNQCYDYFSVPLWIKFESKSPIFPPIKKNHNIGPRSTFTTVLSHSTSSFNASFSVGRLRWMEDQFLNTKRSNQWSAHWCHMKAFGPAQRNAKQNVL